MLAAPQTSSAFRPIDFACVTDGGTCNYDPTEQCTDSDLAIGGAAEGGPLTGVHFPAVADKAVLAKAIDAYIKDGWPKSPLVGYGEKFVSNGEKYNVNPLISVVIAQVEYQFGTLTQYVGPGTPGENNFWAVTHGGSGVRFGAYPSIDIAMEEHFALLGGKRSPSYIGPPQNMTTISQIMNQYAPAFENKTPTYIKTIIDGMKKIVAGGGVSTTGAADVEPVSNDCTCPVNQTQAPTAAAAATTSLDSTLEALAKENGGKTSISVSSVDGKTSGAADGDTQMPTRSSYKVYTAYATLNAIEDGRISWNTAVWNGKSVETTMEAMIVNSDNSAAEALRLNSRIGTPSRVTKLLQDDLGLSSKTIMGSGNANAPAGSGSKSTANDFTKFLTLFEQRKLVGVKQDTSYDKLLSFMKRATTDGGSARAGIAAGVDGTPVADKPGWASGSVDPASNDIGIVYLKDKPYVVSILTDKPNQWDGVAKITKGIHKVMGGAPVSAAGDCSDSATTNSGLESTVKSYVWPSYHSPPYFTMKPAYKTAVKRAQSEGRYVGGGSNPGIDCGGFITTLMIDSGFEPKYNSSGKGGYTIVQEAWLRNNWDRIDNPTTGNLQPGDVAINDDHTFVYIGDVEGFGSKVASASYSTSGQSWRTPMAGKESPADSSFNWYRKK